MLNRVKIIWEVTLLYWLVFVTNRKRIDIIIINTEKAVTYVVRPEDRDNCTDSGFYVNVLPWIHWRKGKKVPNKNVFEDRRGLKRTAAQMKLRPEQKVAEDPAGTNFDLLLKQHDNRCALLRELNIDVKTSLAPNFDYDML